MNASYNEILSPEEIERIGAMVLDNFRKTDPEFVVRFANIFASISVALGDLIIDLENKDEPQAIKKIGAMADDYLFIGQQIAMVSLENDDVIGTRH